MRFLRLAYYLLALVVMSSLAGCSQTSWLRSNDPSKMKTVASVGDKSLPIVAGEPGTGTTTQADTEQPDWPPPSGSRISGRVFDDRGKPVPNARVRLVVGSTPGGRENSATTDRSGAFTLHGLRAGRYYTLIAESQGEDGLLSGRAEVRAPDRDARIDVAARRSRTPSDQQSRSIRPTRSRREPDYEDDEGFPPLITPGGAVPARDEDSEQPAEEATSLAPRTLRQAPARLAAADEPATGAVRAGWNVSQRPASARLRRPDRSRGQAVDAEEARPRSGRPPAEDALRGYDDDGENPLPPALDPGEPGSDQSARRDEGEPRSMPDDILPPGRGIAPASYGRNGQGEYRDDTEPLSRSVRPVRGGASRYPASTSRSRKSYDPADPDDANESADDVPSGPDSSPQRRPTWRELSLSPSQVPVDESVQRSSGVDVGADAAPVDESVQRSSGIVDPTGDRDVVTLARIPERRESAAPASHESQPSRRRVPLTAHRPADRATHRAANGESFCQIDPTDRRIVDFQLPGLDGKMVSFHDIDADVILLDFWGSWCTQCRKSITYERELQERLGGKRVQVVGIACEKGSTPEQRQSSAARAARRLGINYPVLVSSMDGSCPVQKALQVQFYPTLIVVDRDGRILHFERGATDATLGRTDRTIATALQDTESRVE